MQGKRPEVRAKEMVFPITSLCELFEISVSLDLDFEV
jgi:hypothetical protein